MSASSPRLSPAQRALLEHRRRGEAQIRPHVAAPAERRRAAPLSFSQERIWLHEQLQPGTSRYTTGLALRVHGILYRGLVDRSLRALVRRHDVLRSVFVDRDGVGRQVVTSSAGYRLACHDVRAESDPESAAARIVAAGESGTFDLATGPLLRVDLIRLPGAHTVLALAMHHMIADAWSFRVLLDELSDAYTALRAGAAYRPDPLPVQFGDFAVMERAAWTPQRSAPVLDRWRRRLCDAPTALSLPYDHPPDVAGGSAGAAVADRAVPPEMARAVRRIAAEERATVYAPLLAAYAAVLHRFTGQRDLLIGLLMSGRTRPELASLIGFCTNNLMLRSTLDRGMTLRGLVRAVRGAALDAMADQELPFDLLVDALRPALGLRRGSLVHAAFSTLPSATHRVDFAGLPVTDFPTDVAHVPFDLDLAVLDGGDRGAGDLTPVWGYDDTRFRRRTIERLAASYGCALAAFDRPDTVVDDVDLLSGPDRVEVLDRWNRTGVRFGGGHTLHGLVEARAAATPDAIAVSAGDRSLTYRELDLCANQLARMLRDHGVEPGSRVALYLQRGLALPIATLAVLKAGAAFVPLDPDYPADRIEYQLEDSRPALVLVDRATAGRLPAGAGVDVLDVTDRLDGGGVVDGGGAPDAPPVRVPPDALAYVVYTSGSTGRPKGAMNAHRGVANVIRDAVRQLGITGTDLILHHAPGGFDLSLLEMFTALCAGAELVELDPRLGNDAAAIVEVLRTRRVTAINLVPSLLRALLDEPGLADCADLRTVFACGEPLVPDLARRFAARSRARLFNTYGPSEVSIIVTFWPCPDDLDGPVLLGPPCANTRMYVLDAAMRPVPAGALGEVYLGGVQVGWGYHDRPGLTAERFVPDPFATGTDGGPPGGRLYRTGDLGRWRDGAVEFAGRADDQVKIRGCRVEPAEIEAALCRHPDVRACAVLVHRPSGRPDELVAFLEADPASPAERVRAHARRLLPPAMVPSRFVTLRRLPLNPHGKTDRRALAARMAARPPGEPPPEPSVPRRDTTEETVARIFSAVLGRDVGVTDDFFDAGGNSLLAVQVVNRLRTAGAPAVPVGTLFEVSTAADLAGLLRNGVLGDGRHWDARPRSLFARRRDGSRPALVLVHPVGGSASCYRHLVDRLPDRPVWVIESAPAPAGASRSVAAMATGYLDELVAFGPAPPLVLGGWSMGGVVALELARLLHDRTGHAPPVVAVDSRLPDGEWPDAHRDGALSAFTEDLARLLGAEPPALAGLHRHVPTPAVLQVVIDRLASAGADVSGLDATTLTDRFEIFAANLAALRSHQPGRYPGPVHYVRAARSPVQTARWRSLTGRLRMSQIAGDHYAVLTGAGAQGIADLVEALTEDGEDDR